MLEKHFPLSSFLLANRLSLCLSCFDFFFHQAKRVLEWLSDVSQPAVDRSFMFTSLPDMVTYFVTILCVCINP